MMNKKTIENCAELDRSEGKTIADILQNSNARVSEGNHWLIWDTDETLGCWVICEERH